MKKSELKKLIIQCLRENKNEYETDYVEYVRDLKGEEPFLMGSKKYQYVLAKYPSGKLDIGVYAFSGDVVYGYDYFRRMYNIRESLNEVPDPKKHVFFAVDSVDLSVGSRDPDAEREIVYQIFRVTTDTMGDEYESVPVGGRDYYRKEDAQKVADELNQKIGHKLVKEDVEHFSKSTNGTVNVDGIDFDYEATVSGNVVGTPQPHGEFYSEIDETSVDVEIENITPEPTDEQSKKIDSAVYDDVMGKNLWDFVD